MTNSHKFFWPLYTHYTHHGSSLAYTHTNTHTHMILKRKKSYKDDPGARSLSCGNAFRNGNSADPPSLTANPAHCCLLLYLEPSFLLNNMLPHEHSRWPGFQPHNFDYQDGQSKSVRHEVSLLRFWVFRHL